METLALLFLSSFPFFLSFFPYTAFCEDICQSVTCGATEIRFPFYFRDRQNYHCGYPGFDLSCNNRSQTVLNLPSSGDYIVTRINYATQDMYIRPDFCGSIASFSLRGTPFRGGYRMNFTIYNCSSPEMVYAAVTLACTGADNNYTVIAMPTPWLAPTECRNISTVSLPAQLNEYGFWEEDRREIRVTWGVPNCRSCEANGGTCGFRSDRELTTVGCSNLPRRGLPRSAKYGIIIGVVIPGLVCIIGLACFMCSRIRAYSRRRGMNAELSATISSPQPALFMMGLDGPTIESYPKSVLGESGRLPKPNDGTCPICLSDYQPKDTLRTLPDCNHYFHANCIDEWLGLNATCPVCRNSPESSSTVTPSSSMSSTMTSSTAS